MRSNPVLREMAVATVRQRRTMFAGSFVALALGATILATSITTLAATSGVGLGKAESVAQVTTALSVMVVAFVLVGTFAFVVDQRTRELALLSLLGTTPRRIRRLIRTETVVVGGAAALTGCLLGVPGAWLMQWWMVENGIAPPTYRVGFHPGALVVTFLVAHAAALLGASSSAWRASRAQPLDALREAQASAKVMTPLRWVFGSLAVAAATVVAIVIAAISPRSAASAGAFFEVPVLCAVGFALLAPVLARPLALLATRPLVRRGALALVVRQGVLNGGRRIAALVAPVVLAVGMFTGILAMESTGRTATAELLRTSVSADLIATPAREDGFTETEVARIREIGGVQAAFVSSEVVTVVPASGTASSTVDARGVALDTLGDLLTPMVLEGSLRDLAPDSIVVSPDVARDSDLRVGTRVDVRTESGGTAAVRVAAVVDSVVDDGEAYVSDTLQGTAAPGKALLDVAPGASRRTVSEELRSSGVQVASLAAFIKEATKDEARSTRLANVVILGIAVVYSLFAIANTLLMNASARSRETKALGLVGATHRQVVGVLAGEALLTVVVGSIAGVASAAASQVLQRLALLPATGGLPIGAPWVLASVIVSMCAATAIVTVLLVSRRQVDEA